MWDQSCRIELLLLLLLVSAAFVVVLHDFADLCDKGKLLLDRHYLPEGLRMLMKTIWCGCEWRLNFPCL